MAVHPGSKSLWEAGAICSLLQPMTFLLMQSLIAPGPWPLWNPPLTPTRSWPPLSPPIRTSTSGIGSVDEEHMEGRLGAGFGRVVKARSFALQRSATAKLCGTKAPLHHQRSWHAKGWCRGAHSSSPFPPLRFLPFGFISPRPFRPSQSLWTPLGAGLGGQEHGQ